EELRQALLPFDSTTPVPAPLGLRFCAGAVDGIILFAPMMFTFLIVQAFANSPDIVARIYGWIPKGFLAWAMLYFTIPEGLWGASLGKAICGLRVVNRNRLAPGLPRAALRTFIFLLVINICPNAGLWLLPSSVRHAFPGQPGFLLRTLAEQLGSLLPFLVL